MADARTGWVGPGGGGLFVAWRQFYDGWMRFLVRVSMEVSVRQEWVCHAKGFWWGKWSRKSVGLVAEAFYWSRITDTKKQFSRKGAASV